MAVDWDLLSSGIVHLEVHLDAGAKERDLVPLKPVTGLKSIANRDWLSLGESREEAKTIDRPFCPLCTTSRILAEADAIADASRLVLARRGL